MYFRPESQDREAPYRIPENYSGNAFSEAEAPTAALAPADEPPAEKDETPTDRQTPQSHPAAPTLLSSLLPPKPRGIRGGLFGDLGSEELLILGILLLLSQNQSDDDIVLLLLLLLFYK